MNNLDMNNTIVINLGPDEMCDAIHQQQGFFRDDGKS